MKKADIDSWKNLPIPVEVAELEYLAEYSAEELDRISRGCIPSEMEDKWFIFVHGRTLQLHRSHRPHDRDHGGGSGNEF